MSSDNDNVCPNISENELSNLLTDALNDFYKIHQKDLKTTDENNIQDINVNPKTHDEDDTSKKGKGDTPLPLDKSNSDFKEDWSKLAKMCNDANISEDNIESLKQTMNTISEKAKDMSLDSNAEEIIKEKDLDFNKIISELMDSQGQTNDISELKQIMPLMSNIMENLLSKDFLYPTLNELEIKYPKYLNENKNSLSKEDYIRYENQLKIIQQICKEFENSENEDSGDEKKKLVNFDKVLNLMETLQIYGSPPPELVDNNAEILDKLNSYQSHQCSIL